MCLDSNRFFDNNNNDFKSIQKHMHSMQGDDQMPNVISILQNSHIFNQDNK